MTDRKAQARPTARPRPRPRGARGVTLLEVVLASTLLAGAAATITGAFAAILRFTQRQELRLAATEIGHRIILQYLDDPEALRPDRDVFPLGRAKFRFLLNRQVLTDAQTGMEDVSVRKAEQAQNLGFMEKLKNLQMVTVEVYEDINGQRGPAPLASISRIYNPLGDPDDDPDAWMRNVANLFSDEPQIKQMFLAAMQVQRQQKQQQDALRKQAEGASSTTPASTGAKAPPKRPDASRGPRRISVPTTGSSGGSAPPPGKTP